MITQSQIAAAVERLAQAAKPERILIFGSRRGGAVGQPARIHSVLGTAGGEGRLCAELLDVLQTASLLSKKR